MAQYIPTLDYYSNCLPLISIMYTASECSIGINLNPFSKPSESLTPLFPPWPTLSSYQIREEMESSILSPSSSHLPRKSNNNWSVWLMSRSARSMSLSLPHILDSIDTESVMCFGLLDTKTTRPNSTSSAGKM